MGVLLLPGLEMEGRRRVTNLLSLLQAEWRRNNIIYHSSFYLDLDSSPSGLAQELVMRRAVVPAKISPPLRALATQVGTYLGPLVGNLPR